MSKHTNDGSRRFGQSIDAYGYDQALNLFNLHYDKVDYLIYAWWAGATLKFTNEEEEGKEQGRDLFKQNLKVVCENFNNGTHTICFYKSVDENKAIDTSTQYSASFNFRPAPRENYGPQSVAGSAAPQVAPLQLPTELTELMMSMAKTVNAMDQRLQALEEQEEEEEEEEEEHPDERIINGIERLINRVDNPNSKVGGIIDDVRHVFKMQMRKWGMWDDTSNNNHNNSISNTSTMDANNPQDMQQLNQAIGLINANWPNFAATMLKLARILQKDKADFDYYVRKIDQEFAKIDA